MDNLTKKQQIVGVCLLLVILCSLLWLIHIEKYKKVTYKQHGVIICEEYYVNNMLVEGNCSEFKKSNIQDNIQPWNWTQSLIS